jgi:alkylation response protein AidB-like acyl-CoA dehydrogenase
MSHVDILPSDEQFEVVGGIARALADGGPAGTDLKQVAELGYLGAGLPEASGGFGLDICDEVLIHFELGKSVADLRILATMLAARMAVADGGAALCESLTGGEQSAGFAVPVRGWRGDGAGPEGELFLLGEADHYLALSPDGGALIAANGFGPKERCESMDATTPAWRTTLAPGAKWSGGGQGKFWDVATLLIASHLVGLGRATLAMGASYAKDREQFGAPIGSFQGIAHPLADCALREEAASNQIYYASIALRDRFPDASRQVTAAWITAMDAAHRNATTNIQTHGAMGYSAETGAHLFLKRAVALRVIGGGVRLHERRMLDDA